MKKLIVFIILITLMNLSFIPLMSLYGLSICPVLRILGFAFGCAYTGPYIINVLITNFSLISYLAFSKKRYRPNLLKNNAYLMYIASYILASIIGLIALNFLFDLNHLSGESRAPEILALTSIVLGITQIYGTNWAMGDLSEKPLTENLNFNHFWIQHSLRTMVPMLTAALLLVHFILRIARIGLKGPTLMILDWKSSASFLKFY